MAEANTMDVIFVDYVLPGEPKDAEKHRVTLKEFLALPQEQLTEQNQKVQKALGQLYQLNDRESPLFNSFPEREDPLVIDCTPVEGNFSAHYLIKDNKVKLEKSALESTELWLLDTFAHELKHAEQVSEEHYKMNDDAQKNDGLKYHQLGYLAEAQAYAFGSYVTYLFQLESSSPKTQWQYDKLVYSVLEKHTKGKNIDGFYDIQCEMMKEVLPLIYESESYRNKFDLISPILRKDKGLTEGEILDAFHFKNPEEAFSLLKDMPRDPLTWGGRKAQLQKEHKDVFESMQFGTPENLKNLVVDKLKSGEMPPKELLTMIEMEFTTKPAENNAFSEKNKEMNSFFLDAEECIRNRNKDMLKFFLNLQVDGKYLMQKEDISDLLKGARDSGRKDVKEAMQEYRLAHHGDIRLLPVLQEIRIDSIHQMIKDDPKFTKLFFKDNLDNKSLSFDDCLEIIEKEFTRPAEEYTSDEHIQNSKDVLKFLLNLQVDGKPLMSGEFISKLCNRVLASGRGDVASVILMPYRQFVFHQNIKNNPEVAKVLVKNTLASDGDSDDCLEIIEKEFARPAEEYASDEHIQNSKDMLKFLLDLQVDGKPVMQEEFISKLFKNARISDRKDVEDAILAYKAEHPDDKRFSEKMFEFNRKDKVAEFVKRQERKAAKVQAIVKNAAKKGATTVKGATEKGIVAAKKVTKKDTAVINVVVTGKKGR